MHQDFISYNSVLYQEDEPDAIVYQTLPRANAWSCRAQHCPLLGVLPDAGFAGESDGGCLNPLSEAPLRP